jgi:hypothetical protein
VWTSAPASVNPAGVDYAEVPTPYGKLSEDEVVEWTTGTQPAWLTSWNKGVIPVDNDDVAAVVKVFFDRCGTSQSLRQSIKEGTMKGFATKEALRPFASHPYSLLPAYWKMSMKNVDSAAAEPCLSYLITEGEEPEAKGFPRPHDPLVNYVPADGKYTESFIGDALSRVARASPARRAHLIKEVYLTFHSDTTCEMGFYPGGDATREPFATIMEINGERLGRFRFPLTLQSTVLEARAKDDGTVTISPQPLEDQWRVQRLGFPWDEARFEAEWTLFNEWKWASALAGSTWFDQVDIPRRAINIRRKVTNIPITSYKLKP